MESIGADPALFGEDDASIKGKRVLGVFAHPDDEVFCAGGAFAKCAAAGAEVVVATATRGEAGQIRDATTAVRRTLGQVREQELRSACDVLGAQNVIVFDYRDGTLKDVGVDELAASVAPVLAEVEPHLVITFGDDGAYGHPDHIAISDATTVSVRDHWRADRGSAGGTRLLHSHFPRSRLSLAERLAAWLVEMEGHFDGSSEYAKALTLFADEATTMRFASDDMQVIWYPPGSLIVEQEERATSLYLILSGSVDVIQEAAGAHTHLRTMTEGQFFGELGVAHSRLRTASVVAVGSVTCLVLSPTIRTNYDGRGEGATQHVHLIDEGASDADVVSVDVSGFVDQKLAALAAHRSQFPIDLDVFPRDIVDEMLRTEHFLPVRAVDP